MDEGLILEHARRLIREEKYEEAKTVLLSISENATAKGWLNKLESLLTTHSHVEALPRWEYCVIGPIMTVFNSNGQNIWFLTSEGVRKVPIPKDRKEDNETALARAVAKLGEDGWELTAAGGVAGLSNQTNWHAIYFKRRIT